MEPPKVKAHTIPHSKPGTNYNPLSHDLPVQFLDKSQMIKSSYHNFHDVESRLSVTKIPVNDFKPKTTAPVALNLKRNYLWKKFKFQKLKKKWNPRRTFTTKTIEEENFWNKIFLFCHFMSNL